MATEIKMPQLGETVVEGTITKWLKQEGDTIEEDELLVEISTDKVDSEVPSTTSGKIQKILVPEGETVKVGTALAVVGEGEVEGEGEGGGDEAAGSKDDAKAKEAKSDGEAQESKDDAEAKGDAAEAEVEAKSKGKPDDDAAQKEAEEAPAAESKPAEKPKAAEPAEKGDTSKRGIISPLVRRLADENDVNLDQIEGTGTGGRIRKQDVMRFIEERKARPAARPAASAEPAPAPAAKPAAEAEPAAAVGGGREEMVPWTNIRRRTAEHMVAAHLETARAWNAVEADWTNVANLRAQAKEAFKKREGFSLTYMPFLAKVICEALLEMPEVNATFMEEEQSTLVKHYVNLGIAVALEGGGLIVPVIKAADEKNLVGLARAVNDVATRSRTKKLSPDDLAGGTFTITNPGPFGSIISVPIIPRGQTAILGFEAIEKRVVVTDDDSIAIRQMGFLSMSWDHRTIDGAEAARFLANVRQRIETTDFTPELTPFL
jgi:2-oxoglutarate dehydrogenase E2 component (dihydrolipoamide succinyltransferase)